MKDELIKKITERLKQMDYRKIRYIYGIVIRI